MQLISRYQDKKSFLLITYLISLAAFPVFADGASKPYPGTIQVHVDATDLDHRIFKVVEQIPVSEGPMALWLPKWTPGQHAPQGMVNRLAGLTITANGQRIEWKRDPLDMFRFSFIVPPKVKTIEVRYQSVTPLDPALGRVVMTPRLFNLQWIACVLYPADFASKDVTFEASLKVPKGWTAFSALDVDSHSGDLYRYNATDFATLADSPVLAGKYTKTYVLDDDPKAPVRLNVAADEPRFLEAKRDHLEMHRKLIKEARSLFDSHHYNHYDFLLALSKQLTNNGLEHHRSTEVFTGTNYFIDFEAKQGGSVLLPHEFTHSWNGKFRRPLDLTTPNFNVPMQDSLLWVYEGQTQFWDGILSARSGLVSFDTAIERLADTVANYSANRPGFNWRALQDTTNEPIIAYRERKPYPSWQLSIDYYDGGALVWLAVDARLRAKSQGKVSLDDFAKAFFGMDNGLWTVKTYTFEDVVATLNNLVPDDWSRFLRERVDGHGDLARAIEDAGWRLIYKDTPSADQKVAEREWGTASYTYSLGFIIDKDGKILDTRWDGPAFKAGLAPGMIIVAVNDAQYSKARLDDAITNAKTNKAPITLLVKSLDTYRTTVINYYGGLRYPALERIQGKPDFLKALFTSRIKP